MSDPTELAGVGVGGLTVGGLLVGLLRGLSARQVSQLDDTLKSLTAAVRDLNTEVRELREAHVAMAKDIGSLQRDNELIRQRIDGLAKHWSEKFEDHRKHTVELLVQQQGKKK